MTIVRLSDFAKKYPGVTNMDNANDMIRNLKNACIVLQTVYLCIRFWQVFVYEAVRFDTRLGLDASRVSGSVFYGAAGVGSRDKPMMCKAPCFYDWQRCFLKELPD